MSYNSNSCGYSGNSCGSSYSGLEQAVSYSGGSKNNVSYMASAVAQPVQMYEGNHSGFNSYSNSYKSKINNNVTMTMERGVDDFLNPNRQLTAFIGDAAQIREFAEEAFFKTTGMEFPNDIAVRVLDENHFREGLQGFAVNRKEQGQISDVVVKQNTMDRVMVILGHEIGHVMSRRLNDARSEEAKAFAFSMEWIKQIKKHNIAGLSCSVCNDRAANNGIHDKALEFVINQIQEGKKPMQIVRELVSGEIRCM